MTRATLLKAAGLAMTLIGFGALAAPPLPQAVRDILTNFSAFEDGFRNDDWDLAKEEAAGLVTLLERARPALRDAAVVPGQRALIRSYGAKLDQLETAIEARDREQIQVLYVSLQEPTLELVELFDYTEHPAIAAINDEMEERIEALEAGEFDQREFEYEAEELDEIYEAIEGFLKARGVPESDIAAAQAVLRRIEGAVERGDVGDLQEALSDLREANAQLSAHR